MRDATHQLLFPADDETTKQQRSCKSICSAREMSDNHQAVYIKGKKIIHFPSCVCYVNLHESHACLNMRLFIQLFLPSSLI